MKVCVAGEAFDFHLPVASFDFSFVIVSPRRELAGNDK
jgi:hypothetical protein